MPARKKQPALASAAGARAFVAGYRVTTHADAHDPLPLCVMAFLVARPSRPGRPVRTAQQRAEAYARRERALYPRGRVLVDYLWEG